MKIREFLLKVERYQHRTICGKPISVCDFDRDIIMACEYHDGDEEAECEIFMVTYKTELPESDVKGLRFLGVVNGGTITPIYVYYRLRDFSFEKVLAKQPMPSLKASEYINLFNGIGRAHAEEQGELESMR